VVGVRAVRSAEYVLCGDDLQILSGDVDDEMDDSSASDFEDLSSRMRQRRDIGRLRPYSRNPSAISAPF
jgi:hypothetical protein